MPTNLEKFEALKPVIERIHRGHCWIKGANGPRQIDEYLSDFMIAEHLAGRKVYGACPIAPGTNVTRLALLDLDSHKGEIEWPTMLGHARGIAFTLEQAGHAPILFRSSGGKGLHIYLLWDEPQDAYSVRAMLTDVLAEHGFTNGAGGIVKKQVEIFPKQNDVPQDGYGNCFILPYAGKSEFIE
jgi:hypothetical protein